MPRKLLRVERRSNSWLLGWFLNEGGLSLLWADSSRGAAPEGCIGPRSGSSHSKSHFSCDRDECSCSCHEPPQTLAGSAPHEASAAAADCRSSPLPAEDNRSSVRGASANNGHRPTWSPRDLLWVLKRHAWQPSKEGRWQSPGSRSPWQADERWAQRPCGPTACAAVGYGAADSPLEAPCRNRPRPQRSQQRRREWLSFSSCATFSRFAAAPLRPAGCPNEHPNIRTTPPSPASLQSELAAVTDNRAARPLSQLS